MATSTSTQPPSPPANASVAFPSHEFLSLLAFNFEEARIWLGDRRMLLIDVSLFAELRRHLVDTMGLDCAKTAFARLGYEAGYRDAQLLHARWPLPQHRYPSTMSPHRFQGFTKLEIVHVKFDEQGKISEGEWKWHGSAEAAAHVDAYGRATEPMCWMERGYATGYSYGYSGKLTLFEEIGCHAMGHECCTVIGKNVDYYQDASRVLEHFDFLAPLIPGVQGLKTPPRPAVRPAELRSGVPPTADTIVGHSSALTAAKELLQSVASTNATVLIYGESGVGKELFTRNLHRLSQRSSKPFVAVNCAAIPDTLMEAELFGVERGAFTGATESRPGRFERAHEGTLFLDEIGSLNYAAQVKLLRAIQEREVERIGGTKPIKVDVRIVAAHNVSLRTLVERNEFREDLFYRLNVFPINVPPLRERREDIPDLIAYYLDYYNRVHGKSIQRVSFETTRALLNYDFPGNIRELQNLIERAVILTTGDEIDVSSVFAYGEALSSRLWTLESDGRIHHPKDLGRLSTPALERYVMEIGEKLPTIVGLDGDISYPELEETLFAALAEKVLKEAGGNISAAARRLGMRRHQLEYRLKSTRAPKEENR